MWEFVEWTFVVSAESEVGEGEGEVLYSVVEVRVDLEVGEGGRELGDGAVESR